MQQMMTYTVLCLACVAGAKFGFAQLRVWAVIPTSVMCMLATGILGVYFDLPRCAIALIIFCALTVLQVSYLVASALSDARGVLGPSASSGGSHSLQQ